MVRKRVSIVCYETHETNPKTNAHGNHKYTFYVILPLCCTNKFGTLLWIFYCLVCIVVRCVVSVVPNWYFYSHRKNKFLRLRIVCKIIAWHRHTVIIHQWFLAWYIQGGWKAGQYNKETPVYKRPFLHFRSIIVGFGPYVHYMGKHESEEPKDFSSWEWFITVSWLCMCSGIWWSQEALPCRHQSNSIYCTIDKARTINLRVEIGAAQKKGHLLPPVNLIMATTDGRCEMLVASKVNISILILLCNH